jgi:hypothetical protein
MYAADIPFIQKWRQAMSYLDEDRESGYQKVWYELQAMAWNNPEMRERLARVHGQWRQTLREAFAQALADYHLDPEEYPLEAMTALVVTFNEGLILERLGGITEGQSELLAMIDRWLTRREQAAQNRQDGDGEDGVGGDPHGERGERGNGRDSDAGARS